MAKTMQQQRKNEEVAPHLGQRQLRQQEPAPR
jgi:hypothetical protein